MAMGHKLTHSGGRDGEAREYKKWEYLAKTRTSTGSGK